MQPLFLIAPPDSALARTAAVLRGHSHIASLPSGGLLTALLHVGVEANIDKASYDHVLAEPAQRLFLASVQGGTDCWYKACRAYTEALVASASLGAQAPWLLDFATEYARLWPLIQRAFPETIPIVLVRNPVATAAWVLARDNSTRTRRHLLTTWSEQATLLARHGDLLPLVRYESLLRAPVAELAPLEGLLGAPTAEQTFNLDKLLEEGTAEEAAWPEHLASNDALRRDVRAVLEEAPPRHLAAIGYPWETAWRPVTSLLGQSVRPRWQRVLAHASRRAVVRRLRGWCVRYPSLERGVRKVKLATEVLLRA